MEATTSSIPKDITNDNQCFLSYKNINNDNNVNTSAIANKDAWPIDFLKLNPTSYKSFVLILPALMMVNLIEEVTAGLATEDIVI